MRTMILSIPVALGLATAAHAAIAPMPAGVGDSAILRVGEGCGAGFWRGPRGGCNPFNGPYGNNRGTRVECPPGFHIGPGGERCWPNRG